MRVPARGKWRAVEPSDGRSLSRISSGWLRLAHECGRSPDVPLPAPPKLTTQPVRSSSDAATERDLAGGHGAGLFCEHDDARTVRLEVQRHLAAARLQPLGLARERVPSFGVQRRGAEARADLTRRVAGVRHEVDVRVYEPAVDEANLGGGGLKRHVRWQRRGQAAGEIGLAHHFSEGQSPSGLRRRA